MVKLITHGEHVVKKSNRPLLAFLGLITVVAILTPNVSRGQQNGPVFHHGPMDYLMPQPSMYPPLRTDMPFDVLVGYIYFDSLNRAAGVNFKASQRFDSIVSTMQDSDTLHKMLRYFYEMIDYDPTAFFQCINMLPRTQTYRNASPGAVFEKLLGRAQEVSPDGLLKTTLTYMDAILDVTVTDTSNWIDPTTPTDPTIDSALRVHCTINDVIKGQNLPICPDEFIYGQKKKSKQPRTQSAAGDCLSFAYRLYWQNSISEGGVHSRDRAPWVQSGNEYIVFLKFVGMGGDSTGHYAELTPSAMGSSLIGMYPVRDGIVYNPSNDFGFGTNTTVADFKAKLRQEIQVITSY